MDLAGLLGSLPADHHVQVAELLDINVSVRLVVDYLDSFCGDDMIEAEVGQMDFLIDLRPFRRDQRPVLFWFLQGSPEAESLRVKNSCGIIFTFFNCKLLDFLIFL